MTDDTKKKVGGEETEGETKGEETKAEAPKADKAEEKKAADKAEEKKAADKAEEKKAADKAEVKKPRAAKPTGIQRALQWLPRLWSNWISLAGLSMMCISGNALLIVYIVDLVRGGLNPYVTALAYVGLPPLLLLGLALALLGAWRQGKREPDAIPGQLLANKKTRRRLLFVIAGTVINLTVISFFSYRGVSYMHSTSFCASACHVMKPQAQAHHAGAHLRVACPDCHVAHSAGGQLQAKLSGLRQLWGVVTNDYARPVPTPVEHLPPGTESCWGCHPRDNWRATYIRIVPRFKSDEKNSRTLTVLRVNVGGLDPYSATYKGIHWHASATSTVKYEVLDKTRTKIGRIFVTRKDKSGKTVTMTFAAPKKLAKLKVLATRTMDCTDCHNRVGHPFSRSAERAVDRLLYFKKIDPALPFVRKQSLALIKGKVPKSWRTSGEYFLDALKRYYASKHPTVAKANAKQIGFAAAALGRLYDRNVFPFMKVSWGSYRSHKGHPKEDSKQMFGCFRCHDDERKTKDGKHTVGKDCDKCHEQLVEDEAKPTISEEILKIGRP
ncbi:MAG: NapC/NirT family cytochrome c [Myxococcales bacterium]|nr:NapC/NirT family cytochrome c [Myxococcales bacterium]